ncbi:restriction endonuclease subunit S [Hafnia alvei]|uniref:restriction endonuclease subunit S n=1 Tax=Hafnia alvei TaxID=569 RepID=UPI000C9EECEF|nr:restriction endonuclease subunit S [Hafnia alvei]MBI0274406.1 restriction endonuclease subunit S [Hafnia alvei]PNK99548.1 hypothetical protein CEQ28_019150 [Hafnia alvei]
MSEVKLPEGWEYSQLLKLGSIVTGKTPSTKDINNFGGNVPFIKPGDLDKGGFITKTSDTLTESGLLTVPKLPVNAIVVTCIGNLGKVGITTKISATNQQINSFICNENLNFKFLYYQICTLKPWLENESSATTIAIVNKGKLSKAPIRIPSLAEQKTIADKLDTLLAQVDSTKARLEQIPQILKRFRQAVLAAAVSGKLISTNSEINKLTRLGKIAKDIRYGTSKKCSEDKGNVAVLRIPNIGMGYIINHNLKYADFDSKELLSLSLEKGDLLLIRSNGSVDLVGKVAVISENDIKYLFAGYLIRIRLDQEKAIPHFISFCLQSPQLRQVIENIARSTSGVNNINSKELASLELPLPPLSEQTEIVRRVEQLFAYADGIEKQVQNALERVNNLTQSILAKAFRGELTAQWRAENPDLISGENSAQALLAKIQQQRANTKTAKRGSSKR